MQVCCSLLLSSLRPIFVSPERMFVETHSDPNSVCPFVRPLKFRLTFFKLLLSEQVRFNYNQTWIIGALWEPSHYFLKVLFHYLMNHNLWMLVQWNSKMCPFHISKNIFLVQVHFKSFPEFVISGYLQEYDVIVTFILHRRNLYVHAALLSELP